MGKTLPIHVSFFVVVSTTLEIEAKRENTSKLLSNLFDMFLGLAVISIMFIFINFITVCNKKVSIFLVYKLQYLCTIYRPMSCAIFSVLVTFLKIVRHPNNTYMS